jgi:hypothetical protein
MTIGVYILKVFSIVALYSIYTRKRTFENLYRWSNLFATTGANRATIYELLPDGHIDVRQVYVDEERSESFFCCAWSMAQWCKDRRPLLAIAGQLGIIRILDLQVYSL